MGRVLACKAVIVRKKQLVSRSALIQYRINLPAGWFKPVASARLRQQALSSSPTIPCLSRTDDSAVVPSLGTALTIRTCNDHYITIGVAEPNLSVLGRGVDVRLFDNFRRQPTCPLHGSVKVVDLKP